MTFTSGAFAGTVAVTVNIGQVNGSGTSTLRLALFSGSTQVGGEYDIALFKGDNYPSAAFVYNKTGAPAETLTIRAAKVGAATVTIKNQGTATQFAAKGTMVHVP